MLGYGLVRSLRRLQLLHLRGQLLLVDRDLGAEVVVVLQRHFEVEEVLFVPRSGQVLGDLTGGFLAARTP